jgi:hypothetical protein
VLLVISLFTVVLVVLTVALQSVCFLLANLTQNPEMIVNIIPDAKRYMRHCLYSESKGHTEVMFKGRFLPHYRSFRTLVNGKFIYSTILK